MIGIGLGISGRRGFSLLDVPDLAIWLEADSGITLATTKISAWASRVGTPVASQGTDANRPTFDATGVNGRPAGKGSTTASVLNFANTVAPTAMTLFLVLTRTTNNNAYVWCSDAQSNGIIENFSANTLEWYNGNGTDRETLAATRTAGAHLVTVTQTNGGALVGYYDGAEVFSKGTAAADLRKSGALFGAAGSTSNGTDGYVPALAVYHRVLTATEIGNVSRRFANRYGVTLL